MRERKLFGTDGIRGVANSSPLEPEFLVRLGRAIGAIFIGKKGRHRILIGKDTRLSGYMIETALASGITSMGADVLLVGPLPTPGVAYLTKSMRADAGVMISASHNPYEDNGIKLFASDGYKLPDAKEIAIEEIVQQGDFSAIKADPSQVGKATRIADAVGRYTVYLKECFARDVSLDGLRVGFDCANGAGYIVGPQTFEELGASVLTRGASPNGRNINAGFGSLYPEIVRKLVMENNLDIGIALDGDADRAIIVDEKGHVLDGDDILALCALYLKERGALPLDRVVATVMSNIALELFLREHGVELLRASVGDRYVLEEMIRSGAALGGEQSGHTIFTRWSTTGDGLLTALKVLECMQRSGKSLSEIRPQFERFPQKLISIEVRSKPDLSTLPEVKQVLRDAKRSLDGRGRVLVRYSGTENKARVMVECEDKSLCEQLAVQLSEVIERELGAL